MPHLRRSCAAALGAAVLHLCAPARAGGFDELPDQGSEALGRGATFTAKADDATAIYYNVAGLARQRGTKLQLGGNLHFNTFEFTRAGNYPDEQTEETPWGGTPFPTQRDRGNPFFLPTLFLTTDFGVFDRLTFGLGFFGPAATGRVFQTGVDGKPAPGRYDAGGGGSNAIFFPTLAAGYRLTRSIDIGVGLHAVVGSFDESAIIYADSGGSCPNVEAYTCDGQGKFKGTGATATASLGVLARVAPWLQLGAQLRGPSSLTSDGETLQKLGAASLPPAPGQLSVDLPAILRVGVRYIGMREKVERYDVELDATWENWGSAQDQGPTVKTTVAGQEKTIVSLQKWKDTFSVRLGGAYNVPVGSDVLTLRAGTFYDSPTTDDAYTKIGTNTMAKLAGTVGVGFKHGPIKVNLAYAAVGSFSRTVTNGAHRLTNALAADGDTTELPVTNNGTYSAFSHVVGIGFEVSFSTLLSGKERLPVYGDPAIERLAADEKPEPAPAPAEEEAHEEPAATTDAEAQPSPEDEVLVERIDIEDDPPPAPVKPKKKPAKKPKPRPKKKPKPPPQFDLE